MKHKQLRLEQEVERLANLDVFDEISIKLEIPMDGRINGRIKESAQQQPAELIYTLHERVYVSTSTGFRNTINGRESRDQLRIGSV